MKLGIYGGTFSPPHKGHIAAAEAFVKEIQLDKLLIIPTFIPPHKEYAELATPQQRLDMCRLAFESIPCAEVSDIEIQRGGKSFTYMTLEALFEDGIELYLLCGTDMILTLDEWKNFERIFELASICYVRRESDADIEEKILKKIAFYRDAYGADIRKIDNNVIEISSTQVRSAVLRDTVDLDLLDERTRSYIIERGLYR